MAPIRESEAQIQERQRREAFEAAAEFYSQTRDEPARWLTSGLFKINSEWVADKDGHQRPRRDDEEALVPFRPTKDQVLLLQTLNRNRKVIIVKDRRRKVTSAFMMLFLAHLLSRSGDIMVFLAHKEETQREIFDQMVLSAYNNLVPFRKLIVPNTDRLHELELEGKIKGFEKGPSKLLCFLATLASAKQLRGLASTKVLATEVPYYENMKELVKAASAAIHRNAIYVEEGTANGYDEYFAPKFMENYRRQGAKNWWLPGYNLRANNYAEAIFFPWITNDVNRLVMHHEASAQMLLEDLDDEEREIWEEHLLPTHRAEMLISEEWKTIPTNERELGLRRMCLEYLCFRRAKLAKFYPNVPINFLPAPFEDKEDFDSEYPLTPEKAFSGSGQRLAFPVECVQFADRMAACRKPVFQGTIHDRGGELFELEKSDEGYANLWLWKWPWDCKGTISFMYDPNQGDQSVAADGTESLERDYAWGSGFDWLTGEQVFEFASQDLDLRVEEKLWALHKFLSSMMVGTKMEFREKRFPFTCQENINGAQYMQKIVRHYNAPHHQMFQDLSDSAVRQQQAGRYGFDPKGGRKKRAVSLAIQYLRAGKKAVDTGIVCERQRIIYSPRMAKQLSWFIRATTPSGNEVFQAMKKNVANKEERYDDAVTTLLMDCYVHDKILHRQGLTGLGDEPEVKREPRDVDSRPATLDERIAMEIRMEMGEELPDRNKVRNVNGCRFEADKRSAEWQPGEDLL